MRPQFFLFLLLFLVVLPFSARADLNAFLGDLNHRAAASPLDYNTRLGSQFGVPPHQVATLMRSVAKPADAFMVLQLAHMRGMPHDRVLNVYNSNRNKGWGVIAKELGIKPGSPEFHALKDGRFTFTGTPSSRGPGFNGPGTGGQDNWQNANDPSPGKGKGHNKHK